jgi:peroxiredoxin
MHVRSPRVVMLFSVCLAASAIFAARARAQQPLGFAEPASRDLVTPPFSDADVDRLMETLEGAWGVSPDSTDPTADPELQLWKFTRWIQTGELSPEQTSRVRQRLAVLGERYPERSDLIARELRIIPALTIGKPAPEIVGRDLDGQDLRLSDYRGKIVVLTFSGDWCGICRAQYPYQRLLLDLYKNLPFAIVSVSSDTSPDVARRAKAKAGLDYRSWWDGYGSSKIAGPISTAYNVYGWPTTYVLDEHGTIRFVDLRQEDLLKAVRQLMDDLEHKLVLAQMQPQ